MDPYLEPHWGDVHTSLVTYTRDALRTQLPPELRARVEERVVLETPQGLGRGLFPDVRVVEFPPRPAPGAPARASLAVPEPLIVEAQPEPMTDRFIQIIDRSSGNRVVTVIEVISPANKLPGPNRKQYLRKQQELVRSDTSLVEIDLLRQGRHVAAVALEQIPTGRGGTYLVCVRRAGNPTLAELYPISLRQPLPTVKVPLRPQDADALLDLQAMVRQAYESGSYEGTLDYSKDPEPRLRWPDEEWIDQLLREKGLRPQRPARRRKGGTRGNKS
jgi:hypothetical protein